MGNHETRGSRRKCRLVARFDRASPGGVSFVTHVSVFAATCCQRKPSRADYELGFEIPMSRVLHGNGAPAFDILGLHRSVESIDYVGDAMDDRADNQNKHVGYPSATIYSAPERVEAPLH